MPHSEASELIADVREQVLFLRDLGVEALEIALPERRIASGGSDKRVVDGERREVPADAPRATYTPSFEKAPPPEKLELPKREITPVEKPAAGSRLAVLPSLKDRKPPRVTTLVEAAKERREEEVSKKSINQDNALIEVSPKLEETADTIESIREEIGECMRCPLREKRIQVVHTTGNLEADLMFIGEAPGADEDEQGVPFIGRAGQLLTKIIESIGYKREDVAIGNINRCRPPGNRAPTLVEAHTCRPFLLREIAVIKPKVIVVLGNTALHNLLDTKTGITKIRGQFQDYFGVKVMPTFHPAYLLRDPNKKREVWEDMKKVREYLSGATGAEGVPPA
jgi:uracil-DNA glycosylase family 4